MAYSDYIVKVTFNDGSGDYDLPYVQSISDPKEGMKAVVHEGTRADGSIVIPSGKRSQNITIRGILFSSDGYEALTDLINELKASITTNQATLTLKHYNPDASGGGAWENDWQYTVRRIEPIEIDDKSEMRTSSIEYNCQFLVLGY